MNVEPVVIKERLPLPAFGLSVPLRPMYYRTQYTPARMHPCPRCAKPTRGTQANEAYLPECFTCLSEMSQNAENILPQNLEAGQ